MITSILLIGSITMFGLALESFLENNGRKQNQKVEGRDQWDYLN